MYIRAVRNGTKYIFLSFLTGAETSRRAAEEMRLGLIIYENRKIVGLYYGPALGLKDPEDFDCYISQDSNSLRKLSWAAWNLAGHPLEVIKVINRDQNIHEMLTEYMMKLIAAEAAAKLTGD